MYNACRASGTKNEKKIKIHRVNAVNKKSGSGQVVHTAGVFLVLSGWDASPTTWMDGGNVRVYCLTQEYDTASPARSHA